MLVAFSSSLKGHTMRWLIAILSGASLVIVDQFRFRGYYGHEFSSMMQNAIASVTQ